MLLLIAGCRCSDSSIALPNKRWGFCIRLHFCGSSVTYMSMLSSIRNLGVLWSCPSYHMQVTCCLIGYCAVKMSSLNIFFSCLLIKRIGSYDSFCCFVSGNFQKENSFSYGVHETCKNCYFVLSLIRLFLA